MFIEEKDGANVYGGEYSGRYAIVDAAPRTWRVYAEEDYLEIKDMYSSMADELGVDILDSSEKAKKLRSDQSNDLRRASVRTLKTRKEARNYVENIGGTWR